MSDKLAGIRAKIERAKEHIAELEQAMSSFHATKPYDIGTQRDPQTGYLVYYVARVDDVPERIQVILGEIVHQLRSLLDHLAMQLWLVGTGGVTRSAGHVHFPIAGNATAYKDAITRGGKVTGLRQDAIDVISAIEPYKGGNGERLWILSKLDNISKHRLLLAVGSLFRDVDLGPSLTKKIETPTPAGFPQILGITLRIRPEGKFCPLKVGDKLIGYGTEPELDKNVDFRFEIAVDEPQIVEGKPICELVEELLGVVEITIKRLTPFV